MRDAFDDLTYTPPYRKIVQTTENSIAIHRYDEMSHDINGEFARIVRDEK